MPYVDGAALARRNTKPALSLPASPHPRIGIAWAGSATDRDDAYRLCLVRDLLRPAQPGLAFYSLQTVNAAAISLTFPPGSWCRIWSRAILGIWP